MRTIVAGSCEDRFQMVRAEFEKNFADRGEIGASLAIYFEGQLVVDLWGGRADIAGKPWERDTLVNVFSLTKAMSAIALHILIDRGLIDLDAPVARYWPEFGCNGKEAITVAEVLSHQGGLPYWQTPIAAGGLFNWELATSALATCTPIWEPGTTHGYHAITSGFIWGEIVRRVAGQSIGTFFRKNIALPLDADAWIGLPETEETRVAPVLLSESHPNSALFTKLAAEPDWFGGQMLANCGDVFNPDVIGSRAFREAEVPAIGGLASAAGVARLFAPLAGDGSIDGVRLVRASALSSMREVRAASDCDLLLRIPTSFTCGFSKSWGRRADGPGNYSIFGRHAFGTPGMGGSVGFADPDAGLAFGYVMNQHGPGVALNERGQCLIDAAYRAVGHG